MKFLIFSFVIAFILEHYGTLQTESIAKCTTAQVAELFKTYALELVNAAVPIVRGENHMMEEACECIPIYETGEDPHIVDVFLATMSIAKDHHEALQVIENTTHFSEADIDNELVKNMRKILSALDPSVHSSMDRIENLIERYLVAKRKQCSTGDASGYTEYKKSIDSARKCYRFARSMNFGGNEKFFDGLLGGFQIVAELMYGDTENDPQSQRADLGRIIDKIRTLSLHTPHSDFVEGEFNELLEWLRESQCDTDSDVDSDEE